jgi:thymidine kinase
MGNDISTMTQSLPAGSLQLFVGPMYAGKTSKLIETYEECIDSENRVIVLTHSDEIRYSIDKLSTHDQKKIDCFKCDTISSFINEKADAIKECKVILIDEGQFFKDLLEILPLINQLHKHVYVFGLDGDFKRNKFGQILDLIPHCDRIEKLHAKCSVCSNQAIFSHRTNDSSEQVLIGNETIYQPLCRDCYNSKQTP